MLKVMTDYAVTRTFEFFFMQPHYSMMVWDDGYQNLKSAITNLLAAISHALYLQAEQIVKIHLWAF
jgi:hypothetical protein